MSNIVASAHLEKAVATLRTLPKAYRTAQSLDERLESLQQRLRQSRKDSLSEMMRIERDPIEISAYIRGAKQLVSGHDLPEALLRFALVLPLVDVQKAREATIKSMRKFIFTTLFGGSTLSEDGRKVAPRRAASLATTTTQPSSTAWSTVTRALQGSALRPGYSLR